MCLSVRSGNRRVFLPNSSGRLNVRALKQSGPGNRPFHAKNMKQAIKLFQTSRQLLIVLMLLGINTVTLSQTQYYDAAQFPLLGKITDETETRYERLPAYLQ